MAEKSYGVMHGLQSSVGMIQGHGLQINVVGCRNLADKEWFSRQDPYVIIEYGTNKFRTRTDRDGGKNPMFNEKFTIPLIEGLREVNVQVWNSNTVAIDDYIGSARVLLDRVLSSGYDDTAWQLRSKSGKTAGEVNLIMHYSEMAKKQDKHGYGAGAGAGAGAGYPSAHGGGYASSGYPGAPTGYPSSYSHAPASGYPQPVPYGSTGYAPAPASGYPPVAQQSYPSGPPSPYSHSQSSHGSAYPAQGYPPAGYAAAPPTGHGSSSYPSSQYPAPYPGSSGQPPSGYPPGAPPPYGAPPAGYYDHRPHH